jgi:signal transduction histidine kinase
MVVIIEDITERVRLEEQLQISEKMASVGLLAAGVAHEVNTPLTGISSFTQLLLDGANPNDPTTDVLKKIEIQTFRAAKIVNGLLSLARPGRSDATGPVDINGVINEVLVLLEPQLAAGSVQVRREMSDSPIVVVGEEFKLQQVFLNLFLNALDSMPTGGWLSIDTDLDEQEAVVKVSDTGSGIQPEFLSRIYDPFFTTKAPGKGTGLGLSVIYGVVQEHQGVIECESEPDKGTRFTLRLPVAALKMQTKRAVK